MTEQAFRRNTASTPIPIDCDKEPDVVLKKIKAAVASALTLEKIPVLLGGEHTVSVGAFQAIKETIKNVGIIQFDAHADCHQHLKARLTAMPASCPGAGSKIPFSRSACAAYFSRESPAQTMKKGFRTWMRQPFMKPKSRCRYCRRIFQRENIYITFDVDTFDPSIMPAGTPWNRRTRLASDI
ncbi:MAG: arginase family protein [Desulfobacterales bacterium]